MSITLDIHQKDVRQHTCRTCKGVLMESGYLRFPGVKEIRMVGTWKKENYGIKCLYHPLKPGVIIAIDVHCICNRCGSKNIVIVATGLDEKNKIRVQYNKLEEARGKIYG